MNNRHSNAISMYQSRIWFVNLAPNMIAKKITLKISLNTSFNRWQSFANHSKHDCLYGYIQISFVYTETGVFM